MGNEAGGNPGENWVLEAPGRMGFKGVWGGLTAAAGHAGGRLRITLWSHQGSW